MFVCLLAQHKFTSRILLDKHLWPGKKKCNTPKLVFLFISLQLCCKRNQNSIDCLHTGFVWYVSQRDLKIQDVQKVHNTSAVSLQSPDLPGRVTICTQDPQNNNLTVNFSNMYVSIIQDDMNFSLNFLQFLSVPCISSDELCMCFFN